MEADPIVKKIGKDEGGRRKGRSLSFYNRKKTNKDAVKDEASPDTSAEAKAPDSPARRRLVGGMGKRNKSDDVIAGGKNASGDASDSSVTSEAASSPRGKSLLSRSQKLKGALFGGTSSLQRDELIPIAKSLFDPFDQRLLSFFLSFLSGDDLLSARAVSKSWLTLINTHNRFLWKSACINLWKSQLVTFSTIEPELVQSAHPAGTSKMVIRAYLESVLNSSTSDDWRRLYFLSTRGLPLDTSSAGFPKTCAPQSKTASPSTTLPLRVFSPLQLLLRGDLRAFELISPGEQNSTPAGDEHFLDTTGSSGTSVSESAQHKTLWSVKIFPGFVWRLLAIPSDASASKHFIAHTALLTSEDGKVISNRGGQGLTSFLSGIYTKRNVAVLPSFLRLLSIAYAVPEAFPIPFSSHNIPRFLPDGSLVFFHWPGDRAHKTLVHTLSENNQEDLVKEGDSSETPSDGLYRTCMVISSDCGICLHRAATDPSGERVEWTTKEVVSLSSLPAAPRRSWRPQS